MPRVSSRLINGARKVSPLLPPLLKANKSINAAKQELKWIQQELPKHQWRDAIKRRSKLEPLQYILKSQPFGPLDIACRAGVLIPRWETEEWCFKLSDEIVKANIDSISILDACCGTGCIPLALNYLLSLKSIENTVIAFDISSEAINLAKENNIKNGLQVCIKQADLLADNLLKSLKLNRKVDLITSNPPYIPFSDYRSSLKANGVERSVRLYEPGLALIGDTEFYKALIENLLLPLGANGFVFELGYIEQADYVFQLLKPLKEWKVGKLYDSNNNIRCVSGWKTDSNMLFIKELCSEYYN